MDFNAIQSVVAEDFKAVDRFIQRHLDSGIPLIREISDHIVNSGGKRLRPLVAILSARAAGYQGDLHVNVAAVIEFLHTSTLLHDDVVDESRMRRGRATANQVWGNAASVLVGDFLISRSFQLVVEVGDLRLMEILADSTNTISEGEVLQLINCRDPDTSEERYMQVIHHKTAKMFESAARTGAVLGCEDPARLEEVKRIHGDYGRHLGIAFQLVDDVLDYTGDPEQLGKNVGDDLAEGKPTLPLIHAMREAPAREAAMIRDAIRTGGLDRLQEIIDTVQQYGGLDYTLERARFHTARAQKALESVPASRYRDALAGLAREAVDRSA